MKKIWTKRYQRQFAFAAILNEALRVCPEEVYAMYPNLRPTEADLAATPIKPPSPKQQMIKRIEKLIKQANVRKL